MKKKTQKIVVWSMLLLMCLGVLASFIAYFIQY